MSPLTTFNPVETPDVLGVIMAVVEFILPATADAAAPTPIELNCEFCVVLVNVAALPVVFWLSVGMSAATTVLNDGTPAEPFGAAKNVLAVCDAKLEGVTAKVPPNVKFPDVVTVPDRLIPETVPVPPTDVTVPEPVPAPIAVLNVAASRDETVLSAFIRGNVTALGFVNVKKLLPTVVAPKLVLALGAVVAPVPPLRTATVPVTFAAVPVVFWFSVGTSPACIDAINTSVPLPLKYCPDVTEPANASNAA